MYTPKSGNQKTCSKKCREAYIKKMQPIWNKRSYQRNKAKRIKTDKAYAEEQKTYRRDYYRKNKDKIKKRTKEWRIQNKDKQKAYEKKWREKNKTHLRDYRRQRRAKQIDDAFNKYHEYLKTIE